MLIKKYRKRKSRVFTALILHFTVLTIFGCSQTQSFYPKPKGYPRISLPDQTYLKSNADLPYSFEHSQAAVVVPDKSLGAEPNWVIVKYPALNAMIQLTYKPLKGNLKKLDEHIGDAYKLAAKHQIKSTGQKEYMVTLKNGRKAVVIEIEGEVPSHFQFYTTDTSMHYVRGAVYLREATLNDSLAPVVAYLKQDCMHLLQTLKWKK